MNNQQEKLLRSRNAELEKELAEKNRDLEIEASLERVRARTMAMQHSDELSETAFILFQQFKELGENPDQATIGIINEEEGVIEYWVTMYGSQINKVFKFSIDEPNVTHKIYKGWKAKKKSLVIDLSGKALYDFTTYRASKGGAAFNPDEKRRVINVAFFSKGLINVQSNEARSEESIRLLERFAGVFDGTYTRFLDLKKAEAQATEARIETALEKVRSRSLAMHKTDELQEVVNVVFDKLQEMDIALDSVNISIPDEKTRSQKMWIAVNGVPYQNSLTIPYNDNPISADGWNAWDSGMDYFSKEYSFDEKNQFFNWAFEHSDLKYMPAERKNWVLQTKGYAYSIAIGKISVIWAVSYSGKLLNVKEGELLKRFGSVFEQAYIRFLDLQKAEAQAREAQIELALERVRARTMAMQKSEELKEIIKVVYEQLVHLNILAEHAGFIMDYRANDDMHIWLADKHFDPSYVKIPYFDSPHWNSFIKAKKKGTDFFANLLSFEEKNKFYRDLFALVPGVTDEAREYYFGCPGLAGSTVLLDNVGLYIENFSGIPYTDEENSTLMRFGKVFQQTYTRFLDLQKAEAQAHEAQIELGLERVRARTMAMQKSDELKDVVTVVLEKLIELKIATAGSSVTIRTAVEGTKDTIHWIHNPTVLSSAVSLYVPYYDHPFFAEVYTAFANGRDFFSRAYTFEEKNILFKFLFEHSDYKHLPDHTKNLALTTEKYAYSVAFQKNSSIAVGDFTGKMLSEKEIELLKRFAKVFEQAYIRFLDLQKAEAQAREAQIELSLERVRASAMAMHKTDQLLDAAELLYKELTGLGINSMAVTYAIMAGDKKSAAYYSINPVDGKINPVPLDLTHTETEVMRSILSSWKKQETFSKLVLDEKATLRHQTYIAGKIQAFFAKHNFDYDFSVKAFLAVSPKKAVIYTFNFAQGYIFIIGSEHLTKPQEEMVMRFAKVFEMTYRRFLDLQRAEEQAKESQIQLALERVRARTMAMQKSGELAETATVLFQQLLNLGISPERTIIGIPNEDTRKIEFWGTEQGGNQISTRFEYEADATYAFREIYKAWQEKKSELAITLMGKNLEEHVNYVRNVLHMPFLVELVQEQRILYNAFFSKGWLEIVTPDPEPKETLDILERFAGVFDGTYTRFLDLQKAEAQSRESQIQLGLERVRARTMAMQKSDELPETSSLLFQQVKELGEAAIQNSIAIVNEEAGFVELSTTVHGSYVLHTLHVPIDDPYVMAKAVAGWKAKRKSLTLEFKGQELKDYNALRNSFLETKINFPEDLWVVHISFFSKGWLSFSFDKNVSNEIIVAQKRFSAVFDQTYTRFLDLQKAEAQSRESQIQLGLERVRAKAMAMQTSEELNELIGTVFSELTKLDFVLTRCLIMIFDPETKASRWWMANSEAPAEPMNYLVQSHKNPAYYAYLKAWKARNLKWRYTLKGKVKRDWDDFLFVDTELGQLPGPVIAGMKAPEQVLLSASFNNFGCLTLVSLEPLSEEHSDIMLRFAKVFDMSYTRFNDLKQAEAQAREAQIELALERVRAKTMAMHTSEHVGDTIATMFDELVKLGIEKTARCGISIIDDNREMDLWRASYNPDGKVDMVIGRIDMTIHPLLKGVYQAWKNNEIMFSYELTGKDQKDYFGALNHSPDYPVQFDIASLPAKQIISVFFFPEGCVYAFTLEPLSADALKLFKRFASVFGLTYRRYLDLQKAEAQATEAQIQLALERVRARTMAMQKSEELAETVSVLFKQLLGLGIRTEQIRTCGIVTFDTKEPIGEQWITETNGEIIPQSFKVPYNEAPAYISIYESWKRGEKFKVIHLEGKPLKDHLGYLAKYTNVPVRDVVTPQQAKEIYNHVLFFSQGCLFIITKEQLSEYHEVFKRFGSVFQQSYTRFLDLQKAETQAREAQIEAALERVRSKTMAMHSSSDVADTAAVMFDELVKLGVEKAVRCGLGILTRGSSQMEIWTAKAGENEKPELIIGHLDMSMHPMLEGIYDAWHKHEHTFSYVLANDDRIKYYESINNQPDYPIKYDISKLPSPQYNSDFFFAEGVLFAFTSQPLSAEISSIFKRFTGVFSQTYRRFLDLLKAEAQAKEAQIQLALERVRARTMAMQKSDELAETATVLFQQLLNLSISSERTFIGMPNDDTRKIELWGTEQGGYQMSTRFEYEADATYAFREIYKAWQEKRSELTVILKGKNLEEHVNYVRNVLRMPLLVELVQKQRILYNAFFSKGLLMIVTPDTQSKETLNILERFAGVFDGTYTRFLDLQKSETQARESQIQLGLERVRARTMAMQKSEELAETAVVLFQQFYALGVSPDRVFIATFREESSEMECWTTDQAGTGVSNRFVANLKQPSFAKMYKAWKSKKTSFTLVQIGKELKDYISYLRDEIGVPFKKGVKIEQRVQNVAFFSKGLIGMTTPDIQPPEMISLIERFATVFDLAYTRFNDLKQAEAQVREAQVEAALERVRSKTMAMHNSQHVAETVAAMVDELIKLGIDKSVRSGIGIINENKQMQVLTAYAGPVADKIDLVIGHLDMTTHQMLSDAFDNWKKKKEHSTYMLTGDDQVNYYRTINNADDYSFKFDIASLPERQFQNAFYFREGYIYVFTHEQLTAEEVQIYKRFAGVFGLTYRRYLDLLNAEEQAREAQIEAALERVRSKAMAMRSSDDLNATANTVFIELRKLDVDLVRCGVGLLEKQSHISIIHAATNTAEGASLELLGKLNMDAHPVLMGIYKHWRQNEDYFPVLEKKSLRDYYKRLQESGLPVPELKNNEKQYGYFFQFPDGCLYAWSGKQESEDTLKTLKRFTSVIGLTYTRYIELQKAESNTKEAIKQASLDRVRAEIASMRKRSDLERITPLIWDELTILGIPFIRCGVFIMDEEQKLIHTFLSTPDGKAIGAFHIPFDTSGNFEIMVGNWRNKEPYIDHWKEEAFSQFADALVKQGAISSKAQYMRTLPHEGVHLNFLPFLQGMLYVGNIEPLTEDNIDLIQAVADAFSTAYARYEDFNKLEAAKQQVDNTLADLKATQTRLIQSEKMASLGELTAGIAHEIQNPLNFVNNFSEVNQEMLEELKAESEKPKAERDGKLETELINDLIKNEQKINHHGKRADAIVKGMLQHSRSSGGEKQLTDMNTLADEFMRLAYHGLRAKDKSFNAEMVTHFDPGLPKVNAIPQDIGRVLLNLFNNAFYAVNQKSKTAGADYKPEVNVTTLAENQQVIIKVKDNGAGIPDAIKEKIMQPFFTTKPTGEGTGLGLSLTYDMVVKGHGGSIQVNSVECDGSEFIIQLPLIRP